jgi:hypothetical protein
MEVRDVLNSVHVDLAVEVRVGRAAVVWCGVPRRSVPQTTQLCKSESSLLRRSHFEAERRRPPTRIVARDPTPEALVGVQHLYSWAA